MGFFGAGGTGPGEGDPEDPPQTGALPSGPQERLGELTGAGGLFTSTLGVGAFAALTELECVPLGQVLGASVHQIGWQYLAPQAQWGGEVFCELDQVTRAWDRARNLAFGRLTDEARRLGADAVVGVALRRGDHDWARSAVDYVVTGTAIREPWGETTGQPVLTDLSGQEYRKLSGAGWKPSGLVAATTVFFVSQSTPARWRARATMTRNRELDEFTRGFAAARETTVRHLRRQADRAGACGVVGVTLEHDVSRRTVKVATNVGRQSTGLSVTTLAAGGDVPTEGRDKRDGLAITIHAVGTAIRRRTPEARRLPEVLVGLRI